MTKDIVCNIPCKYAYLFYNNLIYLNLLHTLANKLNSEHVSNWLGVFVIKRHYGICFKVANELN